MPWTRRVVTSSCTLPRLGRTMAPQQASIASFFTKFPASPTSPKPEKVKTSGNIASSSKPTFLPGTGPSTVPSKAPESSIPVVLNAGDVMDAHKTPDTKTAAPGSSPLNPGVKRSGGLSDAAKRAIMESALEAGGSKKPKLDAPSKPVADLFLKAAGPFKAVSIPRASSRGELRTALASHPKAKDLLALELEHMGEDWLLALQDEFTKPYFLQLKEFVTNEQKTKKVFPPAEDIYSWSTFCPLKDVKVVVVGQDPYHDDGQAHGLAFSVRKGMRIPPSLRNIYKEMAEEIPGFVPPKHGDLTEWAKHGVLLLNTSLTVRAHDAGSHSGHGWETFTAAVLKVITSRLAATNLNNTDHVPGAKGVVFMAWGAHAQKTCTGVDKNKHLVLRSAHPSPLAAMRGFFGNGHFKQANEWLRERYGPDGGIDWKVLSVA